MTGLIQDTTAVFLMEYGHPIQWKMKQWLGNRFPRQLFRGINHSPMICARNEAIRQSLLLADQEGLTHILFCDNDTRPTAATDAFLLPSVDLCSCRVPMRADGSWNDPRDFHTALWWVSVEVLRALEPPWFTMEISGDGCRLERCECVGFAERVLEAGFEVAWAGYTDHDLAGSWLTTQACQGG